MAWRDGVQIVGTVVWCDARRARDLCFLSHAARSTRRVAGPAHGKVLATARTLALLEARRAAPHGETLVTPLRRPFFLGTARLELFPSGHLPGAASLLVDNGGHRVVYAGEVGPGAGTLAEPMEVRGADVVVIDAPLAALPGALPSPAEARAQLVHAVERARDDGAIPVVLVAALGGAQEAMVALAAAGITVRAHKKLLAYAVTYRALGIALPSVKPIRFPLDGAAILWPLELRHAVPLTRIVGARRIAATGLGLDPSAARKLRVDEVVPLADQIDLDGLRAYVAHSGASAVYLTAGYDERVARALASRKVKRVEPLGPPSQMDLFRRSQ